MFMKIIKNRLKCWKYVGINILPHTPTPRSTHENADIIGQPLARISITNYNNLIFLNKLSVPLKNTHFLETHSAPSSISNVDVLLEGWGQLDG